MNKKRTAGILATAAAVISLGVVGATPATAATSGAYHDCPNGYFCLYSGNFSGVRAMFRTGDDNLADAYGPLMNNNTSSFVNNTGTWWRVYKNPVGSRGAGWAIAPGYGYDLRGSDWNNDISSLKKGY